MLDGCPVLSTWPASAQRSVLAMRQAWWVVAHAASAHAQVGRALGDPSGASIAEENSALGRALGDPLRFASPTSLGWALDVSATTSLPLSVGVEAQLQAPFGMTAQLSLGHTPNAYLGSVSAILRATDVYDAEADPLVQEGIGSGAWNVRAGVGFTIVEGLELGVGYTCIAGSAPLTPRAIEMAIGQPFRWPGLTTVPLDLTLHALHGRVGWRFVFEDHFVVRVALGWTQTVAASASLHVPPALHTPNGPAVRIEDGLAEALVRWGFTPELIVSAGYRF